jgi:hypothetical protein
VVFEAEQGPRGLYATRIRHINSQFLSIGSAHHTV